MGTHPAHPLGDQKHARLDDARLRYHVRVADMLMRDPEHVLGVARDNLDRWLTGDPASKPYYREWQARLHRLDPAQIAQLIVEDSERGRRVRQSSPFVGVLSQEERDDIFSSGE